MDSDRDINMHKVLFLIFFLGVLFGSQKGSFAASKIYQGLFACEVTKISVMQVKEGIPKVYNSLEGRHVEGEIFWYRIPLQLCFRKSDEIRQLER